MNFPESYGCVIKPVGVYVAISMIKLRNLLYGITFKILWGKIFSKTYHLGNIELNAMSILKHIVIFRDWYGNLSFKVFGKHLLDVEKKHCLLTVFRQVQKRWIFLHTRVKSFQLYITWSWHANNKKF